MRRPLSSHRSKVLAPSDFELHSTWGFQSVGWLATLSVGNGPQHADGVPAGDPPEQKRTMLRFGQKKRSWSGRPRLRNGFDTRELTRGSRHDPADRSKFRATRLLSVRSGF